MRHIARKSASSSACSYSALPSCARYVLAPLLQPIKGYYKVVEIEVVVVGVVVGVVVLVAVEVIVVVVLVVVVKVAVVVIVVVAVVMVVIVAVGVLKYILVQQTYDDSS